MKTVKFRNKAILVATMMCALSSPNAQPVSDIAFYPLIENLADATGRNGDVFLEGSLNPPTEPSVGTELCHNGEYVINNDDGQNIQTPKLNSMDINNFEFEVDIKPLASIPGSNLFGYSGVLMGGKFGRWLGIVINDNNEIGIKYNNSNRIFSSNTVSINDLFHTIKVKYYNGSTQLYVDGLLALDEILPELVPFQDDHEFTTTDFNNGTAFHGCIRNLRVKSNDVIFKGGLEPVM